jgi:phospholipid/cholesterol/gamma-HCH transport system ATP-binding protein
VGGQSVLEDLSFDVFAGEIYGVMGMSGAGKSTLLRLMMGLIKPDKGEIAIKGTVINSLPERELNRIRLKMGMCFQGAALFDSLSVAENVAFGLRRLRPRLSEEEIQRRVAAHLAEVGMEGSENKMPAELSGGMRKRVGIARALVMQPEIMLYDEPTAGLDPIMAAVILDLIRSLRDKFRMTSVVVTHEVERLFSIADRVMMIHAGRVIAEDTPERLRCCAAPEVKQFVEGLTVGPIAV